MLRSSFGRQELEGVYSYIAEGLKLEAAEVALQEYCAVADYYIAGNMRAWLSLSREDKMRWVRSDACVHIQTMPPSSWKATALTYGLAEIVFPGKDSELLPSLSIRPMCTLVAREIEKLLSSEELMPCSAVNESPLKRSVKREVEDASLPPAKAARAEDQRCAGDVAATNHSKPVKSEPGLGCRSTQPTKSKPCANVAAADVEKALFAGAPYSQITRECLSYGQVLRGIIAVCKLWFKSNWHEQVAVVNGGCEASARLLSVQTKPDLLIALLYSDQHWALMAVSRSPDEAVAVIYDGLQPASNDHSRICRDHAQALLAHLDEIGWLPANAEVTLQKARVPAQNESWSCGHRAIITSDLIFAELASSGQLPLHIPDVNLGQAHIQELVDCAARCERVKKEKADQREQEEATPAPCTPKRRPRPVDMETPSSRGTSSSCRVGVRPSRRKKAAPGRAKQGSVDKAKQGKLELEQGKKVAQEAGVTTAAFQKEHQKHIVALPPQLACGLVRKLSCWVSGALCCIVLHYL